MSKSNILFSITDQQYCDSMENYDKNIYEGIT